MLCAVYKSSKKLSTYLYVADKDNFESVPKALLEKFGKPEFVMMLCLEKRDKLASADIAKVRESLQSEGFYLQLPPPVDATLLHIQRQNNKIY